MSASAAVLKQLGALAAASPEILVRLDDSAFTMQAAYQAARAVISAHERTELQWIDHAAFFTALDQPAPPTPALKAAFQRHQRTVASR